MTVTEGKEKLHVNTLTPAMSASTEPGALAGMARVEAARKYQKEEYGLKFEKSKRYCA